MKKGNYFTPTAFKLYGLNIPSKYINDINLSNLTITEKVPHKKRRNYFNLRKNDFKGKTEDLSERNKSDLIEKYNSLFSIKYYNKRIKSIEKNMGIENSNSHIENDQLNNLNIKRIDLPLNHMKISFDTLNRNNFQYKKNNVNYKTYLDMNKEKKSISSYYSKNKRNKINIKSSPFIFHQYSINDLSKLPTEKEKVNRIKIPINLPSVPILMKRKINFNANDFVKVVSLNPKRTLINRLHKINIFPQSLKKIDSDKAILHQKKENNNFTNNSPNTSSDNKFNSIKNTFKQCLNDSPIKTRKFIFKKSINPNAFLDLPPVNYYNDNYYYYNIYPSNCGWLIKDCFKHRLKWKKCHSHNTNLFNFKWKEVINKNEEFLELSLKKVQMINHFEFHSSLSNKFNMFYHFAKYCEEINVDIFQYIPFTIVIDIMNFSNYYTFKNNFKEIFDNIENFIFDTKSIKNKIFDRRKIPYKSLFPMNNPKFGIKLYCEISKSHYDGKNLWIVKAPNLNRGKGLKIFNNYNDIISYIKKITEGKIKESELYDIKDKETNNNTNQNNQTKNSEDIIKENENKKDAQDHIYQSSKIIIQKYIEKPFLYKGRKVDIRIWVLITHTMKVYIFKEGHLKASSLNYNIDDFDSFIHITNYSLQKYNKSFSKYEKGNEISFQTFQEFINENNKFDFRKEIFPKFVEIVRLTTLSVKNKLNLKNVNYCFELFGYDFMMDEDKNVYLIEINTNPGLEISSDIIAELVPRMIDDALYLTVDELFPTEYSEECLNENGQFKSKFHVSGYEDDENMWEFVCDLKKNSEKDINNSYNSPPKKQKIKIKKIKK